MRWDRLAHDTRAKVRQAAGYWRGVARFDRATGRSRLPGPLTLQVQTVDRCPGSCVMCPNAGRAGRGPARFIDDGLYAALVAGARRAGTVRRFVLMLQNEPLLDSRLEDRIQLAHAGLGPRSRIVVVTNGELLGPERIASLAGAGLSELAISLDAYTAETFARIRVGLSFDRIRRNAEAALARRGRMTVVLRFVRQRANRQEEREFVAYWKGRGARVLVTTVVNRAGSVEEFEAVRQVETRPVHRLGQRALGRLFPFCTLPFVAMDVLADGRAVLCCHDWEAAAVVGDLGRESLEEVWNGAALGQARRRLVAGPRSLAEPCARCSLRAGPWGFDRVG